MGKRSDTEDYQERVKLDVWYAVNRNFWIDLKMIFLQLDAWSRVEAHIEGESSRR